MAAPRFEGKQRPEQVITDGLRLDGRGCEEFRSVFFKTGVVSQAAGSAYAEFDATKVMVAVYGPRKAERRQGFSQEGRLQVDVKLASFATQQRSAPGQSPQERELASLLSTALAGALLTERFPKAVVDVYCCVLQAGGAEAAVLACAAALALADSGVELRDLVAAAGVSRLGGRLLLDPSADERYREDGHVLLALMPTRNQVTQLVVTGEWAAAELREALELALGGCLQLDGALRDCLRAARAPAPQQAVAPA